MVVGSFSVYTVPCYVWLHIKSVQFWSFYANGGPSETKLDQNQIQCKSCVFKVFRCNCYFYNLHNPTKLVDAIKFATLIISTCSVSNRTNRHHYHQHQYQQGYSVRIPLITKSEFWDFLRSSWQTI